MSASKHSSCKILSIGEILWDLLPSGKKLGGAPSNFAYHCASQGAEARLVTRIGSDPLGDEILETCRKLGLSTELFQIDGIAPTGTVEVKLQADGQPSYTIVEQVAWDSLEATPEAVRQAGDCDAICFGSLAFRSENNRKTLEILLEAVKPGTLRVLDLNLRSPFCSPEIQRFVLDKADILKLNDEELERMVDLLELTATAPEDRLRELQRRFRFRLLILTCGARGSCLTTESQQYFIHGLPVDVVDTVGAGDAYTAAALIGFLKGKSLEEIAKHANELSAYVCGQQGGMPEIPRELTWIGKPSFQPFYTEGGLLGCE